MEKKIIVFSDDDEFINFAINTIPVIYNSNGLNYFDFDFTDQYKQSISNGEYFDIQDELSDIKKRKHINYRLIIKKVDNLK